MNPKLLIISNNPLSTTQHNGKTIQSFVKKWETDRISQLYFRNEKPCFDTCERFFKYTDIDVIKGIIKIGKNYGSVINKSNYNGFEDQPLSKAKVGFYIRLQEKVKMFDSVKLLRELAWKIAPWRRSKLVSWLDEFSPEVILFVGGDAIFAYRITEYIANRYNAKIITYITDDYVTPKASFSPFYHIRFRWLYQVFKKNLIKSKGFATIGDSMKLEYRQRFNKDSFTLMNAVEQIPESSFPQNKIIKFQYYGGLHFNRWKILARIGIAISYLNRKGKVAELEIYTGSKISKDIDQVLNIPNVSKIMGYLSKEEVELKMKSADVLVHVEAFDKKSIHSTRLSVSTKIPEYMMRNRCILGIGPSEVASIKYIQPFAFVITELDQNIINEKIETITLNVELRKEIAKKAYIQANLYHNLDNVSENFINEVNGI